MRIWDIEPKYLCRNHLLGEHRELHAIWVIITQNKKGYSKHPETLRWIGKLKALYNRHQFLVNEMTQRGYNHRTPLQSSLACGVSIQNTYIHTIKEQIDNLKQKHCECRLTFN
jgi:hypothetical protein